jgi:hypothetical protein
VDKKRIREAKTHIGTFVLDVPFAAPTYAEGDEAFDPADEPESYDPPPMGSVAPYGRVNDAPRRSETFYPDGRPFGALRKPRLGVVVEV